MPRLTSVEKGGYYAFPDEHLPAVASLFAPAAEGGRLLDPCAGEGRALQHLSSAWRLTPYANELDTDRAAACQALFGPIQAVQGDLYTLRASLGS
ncbi:MAG: class I SAM-dependent methyltransferase, partial [Thermoleophilia bacterium]|nr:class I SAM-dependent methyltransferase [Thermoleophilia bacterium]